MMKLLASAAKFRKIIFQTRLLFEKFLWVTRTTFHNIHSKHSTRTVCWWILKGGLRLWGVLGREKNLLSVSVNRLVHRSTGTHSTNANKRGILYILRLWPAEMSYNYHYQLGTNIQIHSGRHWLSTSNPLWPLGATDTCNFREVYLTAWKHSHVKDHLLHASTHLTVFDGESTRMSGMRELGLKPSTRTYCCDLCSFKYSIQSNSWLLEMVTRGLSMSQQHATKLSSV